MNIGRRILAAALMLAVPICVEAAMLNPGDPFPDWELTDHTGAQVSSADLAGKSYLLWYYPKASTPGCTIEGQQLRDHAPKFTEKNVEILGISFDTPDDNAAFVEAQNFPYRLLSDRDRSLAVAVGAAGSSSQSHAKRISYLVGEDGKVVRAYGRVSPSEHATQVLGDIVAP